VVSDSLQIKDVTVILRLWLDPSDATVRGRVLVPAFQFDHVARGEQQLLERVAIILRSFERGESATAEPRR
jgi:cytochrome P450